MSSIFVFDAYGTLFDVHAAIARWRGQVGPDADFWTLTERALDFALARLPQVDKALKQNGKKTGIQSNGSPTC
jgi:2-haloacid dehalogenase